jgi:hypothetical protein
VGLTVVNSTFVDLLGICARVGLTFSICPTIAKPRSISRHYMTDDIIIAAIKSSGGWCQLHQSINTALIDTIVGCLISYTTELSFIEKFNISTNELDGYLVIFNNTRQRLKKAQWIKKNLTIGGKTIPDTVLPESLIAEKVPDLMQKLQLSQETLFVRLHERVINGSIREFTDTDFSIEPTSAYCNVEDCKKISYSDIICLELRTRKIQHQRSRWTGA